MRRWRLAWACAITAQNRATASSLVGWSNLSPFCRNNKGAHWQGSEGRVASRVGGAQWARRSVARGVATEAVERPWPVLAHRSFHLHRRNPGHPVLLLKVEL